MAKSAESGKKKKKTLEITISKPVFSIELKLDPKEYYYPVLIYKSDDFYDEEDGFSKDVFEKMKAKSIEVDQMFQSEKYKYLFEAKLKYGIGAFLKRIGREAEAEYENVKPKDDATSAKKPLFATTITPPLDNQLKGNEDIIFNYLEKEGPWILSNPTVLSIIQKWCWDKDNPKITKLSHSLRKYAKVKKGPVLIPFEVQWDVIMKYPKLRKTIRMIKQRAKSEEKGTGFRRNKEAIIIEQIKTELKNQKVWWYGDLNKAVKLETGNEKEGYTEFFMRTLYPPSRIAKLILAQKYGLWERSVDEIIRNKKRIMKEFFDENYDYLRPNYLPGKFV